MQHVKIQSHGVDLRTIFSDFILFAESDGGYGISFFGHIDRLGQSGI